ncbi:hypothetical protein RvY_19278, partial [Ramazzottius varieornatus]
VDIIRVYLNICRLYVLIPVVSWKNICRPVLLYLLSPFRR